MNSSDSSSSPPFPTKDFTVFDDSDEDAGAPITSTPITAAPVGMSPAAASSAAATSSSSAAASSSAAGSLSAATSSAASSSSGFHTKLHKGYGPQRVQQITELDNVELAFSRKTESNKDSDIDAALQQAILFLSVEADKHKKRRDKAKKLHRKAPAKVDPVNFDYVKMFKSLLSDFGEATNENHLSAIDEEATEIGKDDYKMKQKLPGVKYPDASSSVKVRQYDDMNGRTG